MPLHFSRQPRQVLASNVDMFSGRMFRRETKTLEQRSPGKRVKRAGSQGECVLIRIRGLWHCAPCCMPSKQDRRLVTEPVNDTKLASLSVIEQE